MGWDGLERYGRPGGVSYGTYQLASKTGTCGVFVKAEGKPWAEKFGGNAPGTAAFSAAWKAIAAADGEAFGNVQHAFIERTLYRPVVNAVNDRKGVDLDRRSNAVRRDVTWSCAVQHGRAANILIDAIDDVEGTQIEAIRLMIANSSRRSTRRGFAMSSRSRPIQSCHRRRATSSSRSRRRDIQKSSRRSGPCWRTPQRLLCPGAAPLSPEADGSIDGNRIAKSVGVGVKGASVKIGKLHPKMEAAILVCRAMCKHLGLPRPVITSGNDSTHMNGSLHYKNRALDFRGNNFKTAVGRDLAERVGAMLGPDYDVAFEVFENSSNNPLHVEYDPD